MADPVRYLILTQLKSQLEGITTANGYRNDVNQVEIAARQSDDNEIQPAVNNWIGIIPQEEIIIEEPTESLLITWPIDILAHFPITTRTPLGVAEECMNWTHDLRKNIYSTQDLGIDEVIMVSMATRSGSEGAPEAARSGIASVCIRINVQFEETVTDE